MESDLWKKADVVVKAGGIVLAIATALVANRGLLGVILSPLGGVGPVVALGASFVAGWLSSGLYRSYRESRSSISVETFTGTLTLSGDGGATYDEAISFATEQENVAHFVHRWYGDGSMVGSPTVKYRYVANPNWITAELAPVERAADGRNHRKLPLPNPLPKHSKFEQTFSCSFTKAFPSADEYYEHDPVYPEKTVRLVVKFPADRKPSFVRTIKFDGEIAKVIDADLKPKSESEGQYSWLVGHAYPNTRYRVEWKW